jgi:hypothetical protein
VKKSKIKIVNSVFLSTPLRVTKVVRKKTELGSLSPKNASFCTFVVHKEAKVVP